MTTEIELSQPMRSPSPPASHHMRRVFSGMAYDTKLASMLFHWDYVWHAHPDMDTGPVGIGEITQTLYETTHGAYFLLVYNEMGDPWDKGYHEIRPLTRKQAIDWAEKRCQWLIEELFGFMPEPGAGEPYVALP